MHSSWVITVARIFLSLTIFTNPTTYAQDINGIPTCAKECALDFIGNANCPLTNQTCICNYLSFYDTCVEKECNGTDVASANEPPIPYYIPDATISISLAPTCFLSTPNFPRPSETGPLSLSDAPVEGSQSFTANATSTNLPMTSSTLTSEGEALLTTTSRPESTGEPTSSISRGGDQTDPNVRQSSTVGSSRASTSSSGIAQATFTSGAHVFKVLGSKIVICGIVGFVIGALELALG